MKSIYNIRYSFELEISMRCTQVTNDTYDMVSGGDHIKHIYLYKYSNWIKRWSEWERGPERWNLLLFDLYAIENIQKQCNFACRPSVLPMKMQTYKR